MKFSMNGFRRQLSADCENLRAIAKEILAGELFDQEDFSNAVDEIIRHSNVINCVYQKDDPLFVEMSDLEVEYLNDQN